MEIIIGAIAIAFIGYFAFFRKKAAAPTQLDVEVKAEAPYKADPVVPLGTEATMATPAATTLDPVAVALDLEPMQISAPAKAPRKPREPKVATPKVAKPKAAPKAKVAPKAKSKKV
jgi:hypothetical protein